ncbi:MAG: sigma-70 family RNA polymerase sigma factor [Akkermansiaceae bacterium]|nr:sigma-70 family RNA polymerase sigma factor [Akkermansiaceae bacterium]
MEEAQFHTTQWTLLKRISEGSDEESTKALEVVCKQYWPPLYAYVRRKGYSPDDAEDVVQSFFMRLLENDSFAMASVDRGRLRTFLLTMLNRHMSTEWRKFYAQKRGGGAALISLDSMDTESWYSLVEGPDSSDVLFDYEWTVTILNRSMDELRASYMVRGKPDRFEVLKRYLEWSGAGSGREEYSDTARRLKMTEGAVKVAVFRLRSQFREILVSKVRQTLDDGREDEVNDELMYLMRVMGTVETRRARE